ncbi:hypothetical protein C0J52_00199 [Blattella germanica]|nr:hypothetical protein C0J52_00199 [Blattella germanica]
MEPNYSTIQETRKSIFDVVRKGTLSELYMFINARVDLNAYDDSGSTSLHYAVDRKRPDMIQALIENGADPNIRHRGTNNTPVHCATLHGYSHCLRTLVQLEAATTVFNGTEAAIHMAAESGNAEIVKCLLDLGASPNLCSLKDWPPIFYGLEHPDVLEVLVRRGANVNYAVKCELGFTALFEAISNGYPFSVQKLLQVGADWCIFCSGHKFLTAVHWAADCGHVGVMDVLFRAGADLSAAVQDPGEDQPIHIAASSNHVEMLSYLVRKGISVETTDGFGFTPLLLAVLDSSLDAIRFLVQAGANIDRQIPECKGYTALHFTAENTKENLVKAVSLLIELEANWLVKDQLQRTPVHVAIISENISFLDEINKHVNLEAHLKESDKVRLATRNNSCKALKWLLDRGVSMEQYDDNGTLPIHLACEKGFSEIVQAFLDHRMNINARTSTRGTPLHHAVYSKQDTVAEILLAKGADINAKDIFYRRPDHIAAMVGNGNYLHTVKNVIDITSGFAGNEEKELSLHIAARCGHVEVLGLLLDRGCNVDARTSLGNTALLLAARGSVECVQLLLSIGADANIVCGGGFPSTALETSIEKRNSQITLLLLDHGANVNSVGSCGFSPLHLAIIDNNLEITGLLVEFGAEFSLSNQSVLSVNGNEISGLDEGIRLYLEECARLRYRQ